MSPSSLIKLVKSLSSSEKRFIKLQSKMQSGSKEYLQLFKIIDELKNPTGPVVKEQFQKTSPNGSWENTCIYLSNVIVDCLARAKKDKDLFFDLLQGIQKVKILKERSLDHEAFRTAKKLQQKAAQHQQHWIEYFCYRFELNYHSDNFFAGVTDDMLIRIQMKGKDVLKNLNHIHDHYSLYELLKHRLVHAGKIVSEEGKKKLNDLILSEMVLVAGKSKSFASQKLHLLFQSFFFTDVGDYHSAHKSFFKLNELLEKNESFLDNPPLDYLSALNGIIDSLRMLRQHNEISYYLDKIRKLDQTCYPEYFRYQVRKACYIHQLISLIQSNELDHAKGFIKGISKETFVNYNMIDEERQCEFYFYCSLVFFKCADWKQAHLFIREIMNQIKLPQHLLISKAIRLLNIIIYFEKGEILHLDYEVRAYKRYFAQSRMLRTEKLLLRMISMATAGKRTMMLESEHRKIINEVNKITNDGFEQQLLKYYDFTGWILSLLQTKLKKVPVRKRSIARDLY